MSLLRHHRPVVEEFGHEMGAAGLGQHVNPVPAFAVVHDEDRRAGLGGFQDGDRAFGVHGVAAPRAGDGVHGRYCTMEPEAESPHVECRHCKLKEDAAVAEGGIALMCCPIHGDRLVYNITFKDGRVTWLEGWQRNA